MVETRYDGRWPSHSATSDSDAPPARRTHRSTTVAVPLPPTSLAPADSHASKRKGKGSANKKRGADSTLRKQKSATRSSGIKIPRPPNAYICYRSERLHQHRTGQLSSSLRNVLSARSLVIRPFPADVPPPGSPKYQAALSKALGQMWKSEDEPIRTYFFAESSRKADEHRAMYPDYKFKPTLTPKAKLARLARRGAKLPQLDASMEDSARRKEEGPESASRERVSARYGVHSITITGDKLDESQQVRGVYKPDSDEDDDVDERCLSTVSEAARYAVSSRPPVDASKDHGSDKADAGDYSIELVDYFDGGTHNHYDDGDQFLSFTSVTSLSAGKPSAHGLDDMCSAFGSAAHATFGGIDPRAVYFGKSDLDFRSDRHAINNLPPDARIADGIDPFFLGLNDFSTAQPAWGR
ncbi:hypothetical protein K437DRAFT_266676 [Tilletiaria anomala UBC 951]|uniref:HMG box domain-containing protein n=1 Tax=Tilletiaria anomala (strain ATCC 24038 / CBS 436.72 / UBC 951) TaxID=1037660 RepID=A0A066WIF5_TILAU|nr:uncharacterized protein K437DRAFT_266676 [Tilletiaria anomala UBC 951]KDN52303.1 hypothetical protein K437DRAFT_266676 [Tilletiaria anomala UBC 951]